MVSYKPLQWIGAAHRELGGFPATARRAAGYNLRLVQEGLMPEDWKPLETVGTGTYEIRVRSAPPGPAEFRVLFVAKFEEAVYVLHAFEKKSRTTPQHNVDVGRARYAELLAYRRERRVRAMGR